MSIQSQIDRINGNVADTYNVLAEAGAEMPETRNSANLPSTAASITAVLYGKEQNLTEEQKAQARQNIGAVSEVDVPVKGVDYFTEADKAEMVADVKEAIENDGIEILDRSGGYFTVNDGWQAETGCNAKYTDYIPVNSGDRFSYRGYGAWAAPSVIWYGTSKNLLSYEQYNESNEATKTYVVTAPDGSAYVRFFSMASNNVTPVLEVARCEETMPISTLTGKKIVYDGDSICIGTHGGGGYAKIIADKFGGTYDNQAVGGARLVTKGSGSFHSIVDNLVNLPTDGDLYCFDGGVNDVWSSVSLGTYSMSDYTGTVDKTTICGALETIFRYCLNNFVGKPICYIITHKVSNINYDNYKNYHDSAVSICNKYSIPYYDAYNESGLNGWNTAQNNAFLTGNSDGTPDGCHPNEEGYKRYYVPQLIQLFERIMPEDVTEPEAPTEPTYTNLLDEAGYKSGVYLSNGNEGTDANAFTTGFMKVGTKGTIYLKNITIPNESSHGNRVAFYDTNKTYKTQMSLTSDHTEMSPVYDSAGNLVRFSYEFTGVEYIRISAWKIDDTSIITVNEPIN